MKARDPRAAAWTPPRHRHQGLPADLARTYVSAGESVDGRERLIWRCLEPGCRAVFTRIVPAREAR